MIGLNNLKPAPGSHHRKKIVGRGEGSGHGGTSTMGMKGQKSRSGDGIMTGFEGGQMPLVRGIPKKGFTSKFRVECAVINVNDLEECFQAGDEVTEAILKEKEIVKKTAPVKLLGNGEITKALKVKVSFCSKSALAKIQAAGGTIELSRGRACPVRTKK